MKQVGQDWAQASMTAGKSVSDYMKQFESEFSSISRKAGKVATESGVAAEGIATAMKKAAGWQERLANFAGRAAKEMRDTAKSARHIAGDLAESARWLLKWTGISTAVGGLVGAGGLFGLDRLAGGLTARRYAAQGLGVDQAQLSAMQIAFGRFFDAGGVVGNVANAQQDWTKRWAFSGLGYNQRSIQGQNPAALAADMAIRAKRLWDSSDQSQQFAQAHGLLEFYTMEDLRRLHATSMQSLELARAQYEAYERELKIPEKDQTAWVDFYYQLKLAGQTIENTFIETFASSGLTQSLTELSGAAAQSIKTFLSAHELKVWLHDLSEGLKAAAVYMTSPEFQQGVRDFVHGIGQLARSIIHGLQMLGIIDQSSDYDALGTGQGSVQGNNGTGTGSPIYGNHGGWWHPWQDIQRMGGWLGGALTGGGAAPSASQAAWEAASTIQDARIRAAAAIIAKRESGDRDIPNGMYAIWGYRNGVAQGYTASGYYQILDSNWHKYGEGIVDFSKYPHAMGAPRELQDAVFARMFAAEGYAPWDSRHGGSIRGDQDFYTQMRRRLGANAAPQGGAPVGYAPPLGTQFNPIGEEGMTGSLGNGGRVQVTLRNQTGGNVIASANQIAQ